MSLPKKEIKKCKEELKELINKTEDKDLKKEYLYYLYQMNSYNDDDKEEHFKSYTKKLKELEKIYQENKDLFQVLVDYNNSLTDEVNDIDYINENYDALEGSFKKYKFNKKQSILLARNFFHNMDPSFSDIFEQILDKKTLSFRKKFNKDYSGFNYFVGGINKNYIDIKKKGDYTDFLTIVHEGGHAINNVYNPMGYYELNYFDEVISIFMDLAAIYEGNKIFNANLRAYENADNLVFYYDLISSFNDQHNIVNLMYYNQLNKFNKNFVNIACNSLDCNKNKLKSIIDTSFYDDGNYALSYIMALELLYIYKHNKKEAIELLKELMYKLPLNNQVSEISKYLEPNVHAKEETRIVIDEAKHVLKKTL